MKFFPLFCFAACLPGPGLFHKDIAKNVSTVLGFDLLATANQEMTSVFRVDNLKILDFDKLVVWLPETTFLTYYKRQVLFGRETLDVIKTIPDHNAVKFEVFEDDIPGRYKFVSEAMRLNLYFINKYNDKYEHLKYLPYKHQIVLHGYKRGMNIVMAEPIQFVREGTLPAGIRSRELLDIKKNDKADLAISDMNPEIVVPFASLQKLNLFQSVQVSFPNGVVDKTEGNPYLTKTTSPKSSDLRKLPDGTVLFQSRMILTVKRKDYPVTALFVASIQGSTPRHVVIDVKEVLELNPLENSLETKTAVQEARIYFYALRSKL